MMDWMYCQAKFGGWFVYRKLIEEDVWVYHTSFGTEDSARYFVKLMKSKTF